MNLRKRAILALIVTLLITCLISGCSDTSDTGTDGNSDAETSTVINEEGSADLKATGLITYSFVEERPEDWANNINAVYVRKSSDIKEGEPVADSDLIPEEKYTISTVKMILDSDLFPLSREQSETYEITVKSEGNDDYRVGLTVNNRTPNSLTIREVDKDGQVLSEKTFSYDEVAAMCTTESYTSIGCVMHGLVSIKAEGVPLTELFEEAEVTFGPGMALAVRVIDAPEEIEATETNSAELTGVVFENPEKYWMKPRFTDNFKLSYEDLLGRKRYFLSSPWDDASVGALLTADGPNFSFEAREALVSNPAYMTEVVPMIALKYTSLEYNSDPSDIRTAKDENYELTANERAFRFLYGLAMDDDPTVNVTAYNEETKEYPVVTSPEYAGRTAIEEGVDACGVSARNAMLVFGIDIFVDGE